VSEFAGVLERAAQHSTVLLVEQNLSVVNVSPNASSYWTTAKSCTSGRSPISTTRLSCDSSLACRERREHLSRSHLQWRGSRSYLLSRGVGPLADLWTHGRPQFCPWTLHDARRLRGYEVATRLPTSLGAPTLVILAIVGGTLVGALAAGVTELILIRPLYGKPISQILITIGLDLAVVGLLMGGFGSTALQIPVPLWLIEPTHIGGLFLPNASFLAIGAGALVLIGLELFLARTRYGIIIRAGVENREMVRALGIDVGRAFTLVFVIGGPWPVWRASCIPLSSVATLSRPIKVTVS